MHCVWEHFKVSTRPAVTARSLPALMYEDKGLQVRIENGRIAPPLTPEHEQEVAEEIKKIVEELRNLEQTTEQIKEQQITTESTEQPMDLNEILTCCYCKTVNIVVNMLL